MGYWLLLNVIEYNSTKTDTTQEEINCQKYTFCSQLVSSFIQILVRHSVV